MFCLVEDNKIIPSIVNTITEPDWLLGVVDRETTYFLPKHYICLFCPPGCLPCKTSKLSYFYTVNKYVMYNNYSTCQYLVF
jgi:hypothetical protein